MTKQKFNTLSAKKALVALSVLTTLGALALESDKVIDLGRAYLKTLHQPAPNGLTMSNQ